MDALKQSVAAERASGKNVRALVVINPGNPTGTSLTEDQIKQVVRSAACRNLPFAHTVPVRPCLILPRCCACAVGVLSPREPCDAS